MKNKNSEALISTIIFSLLNVAYLAFHFSKWGCIPAVLTIAYYFVCISGKKAEKYTVTDLLGAFLGALCVDFMLIRACFEGIIPTKPYIPKAGILVRAVLIVLAEIIVLIKICRSGKDKYGRSIFGKYLVLLGATIGCSCVFIKWENASILFALLIMLLPCLGIELFVHRHNERTSNTIFIWATVLFILFNAMNCMYGDFSVRMVSWTMNASFGIQLSWYKGLIAILLGVVGIVETLSLRYTDRSEFSDTRVYLMLLSSSSLVWILSAIRTKYNFILIILFAIAHVVFLNLKEEKSEFLGMKFSPVNLLYALTLGLLLGCPVAFYRGSILRFAALSVTVLYVVIKCLGKTEKKDASLFERIPFGKWSFWQAIITLLSVYAVIVATEKCRTVGTYALIGAVYCITTLAFYILSLQNRMQEKNHFAMRILVAVPAVLILLFAVNQSEIKVNYQTNRALSRSEGVAAEQVGENDDITLTVYSNAENADIEKAYCYWLGEKEKLMQLKVGKDEGNTIQSKSDCLCVVCEDRSGLIYTDKHWFYLESPAEDLPDAGSVKFD